MERKCSYLSLLFPLWKVRVGMVLSQRLSNKADANLRL